MLREERRGTRTVYISHLARGGSARRNFSKVNLLAWASRPLAPLAVPTPAVTSLLADPTDPGFRHVDRPLDADGIVRVEAQRHGHPQRVHGVRDDHVTAHQQHSGDVELLGVLDSADVGDAVDLGRSRERRGFLLPWPDARVGTRSGRTAVTVGREGRRGPRPWQQECVERCRFVTSGLWGFDRA